MMDVFQKVLSKVTMQAFSRAHADAKSLVLFSKFDGNVEKLLESMQYNEYMNPLT